MKKNCFALQKFIMRYYRETIHSIEKYLFSAYSLLSLVFLLLSLEMLFLHV